MSKDVEAIIIDKMLKSEETTDKGLIYELKDNRDEWMKITYEEAWRQYSHEDNMAGQRNANYLTLLVILFTGLGYLLYQAISSIELDGSEFVVHFKEAITLLIAIVLLLILIMEILSACQKVTKAGAEYAKNRYEIISKIEEKLKYDVFDLGIPQEAVSEKHDSFALGINQKDIPKKYDGFKITTGLIFRMRILSVMLIIICMAVIAFIVQNKLGISHYLVIR